MERDLSQLAVIILFDVYTGCDEVDEYFATEAATMMGIVYEDVLN